MSEPAISPTARSSLFNLPLLNRIKVVKELLLSKLDRLHDQLQTLDTTANTLAENDVALLEATIGLIETLQEHQHNSQQQNQLLLALLRQIIATAQQTQQDSQQQSQEWATALQEIQQQEQQGFQSLQHLISDLHHRLDSLNSEQQEMQSVFLQSLEAYQKDTRAEIGKEMKAEIRAVHSHLKPIKVVAGKSDGKEPELGLAAHLYSYLPSRYALDIGANVGSFSEALLRTGYEVFAFEPFPPTFEKINQKLGRHTQFHCYPFALGAANETRELHIVADQSVEQTYGRGDLYNSLTKHSMPDDLVFTHSIPVTVRTLESLHNSIQIPATIGLAKIDTEGYDLEVIRGMGSYRYPVVITEFWDSHIPFADKDAANGLEYTVKEMRERGYHWYIVIYRVWGKEGISFYCNYPRSLKDSWGNTFFFQDQQLFMQALQWCSAVLPATHLY